jgi:hypothetical protein
MTSEGEGCDSDSGSTKASHKVGSTTVVEGSLVEELNDSVVSVFSHLGGEQLQLGGAHRLNFLNDGPLDALSAGRGSEGSLVAPVIGHVNCAEEFSDGDGFESSRAIGTAGRDSIKEAVKECAWCSISYFSVEKHSNDGAKELWSSLIAVFDVMHKVHFQVVILSINGMLGWGVEVELNGGVV